MPSRLPEPLLANKRRPITVFSADDDPGFLGVLRTLIQSTPGFALIGEAACGEDAIAAVPRIRPDLLLMDVHMPGVGGIQAARILLRRHPELVVVLISAANACFHSAGESRGPPATYR